MMPTSASITSEDKGCLIIRDVCFTACVSFFVFLPPSFLFLCIRPRAFCPPCVPPDRPHFTHRPSHPTPSPSLFLFSRFAKIWERKICPVLFSRLNPLLKYIMPAHARISYVYYAAFNAAYNKGEPFRSPSVLAISGVYLRCLFHLVFLYVVQAQRDDFQDDVHEDFFPINSSFFVFHIILSFLDHFGSLYN